MKKHRIVFATGNAGKMKEIRQIMADLDCEVVSMKEAGANPEIVENGTSFAENAEIKARAVWNCTGDIVLADDSGLVVDYIGGEPGIYSARYMGEDTSYEIKTRISLTVLQMRRERSAVPALSATLQRCFRTDACFTQRRRWKDRSLKSRPDAAALAMIRSCTCRNLARPLRSLPWSRKMRSATAGKR